MPYVICSMSYVVCRMQYVVCSMSYVLCIMMCDYDAEFVFIYDNIMQIPVGSADPGQPWSKPKALFSGSELFEPFWKLFSPVNWRELLHTNS